MHGSVPFSPKSPFPLSHTRLRDLRGPRRQVKGKLEGGTPSVLPRWVCQVGCSGCIFCEKIHSSQLFEDVVSAVAAQVTLFHGERCS